MHALPILTSEYTLPSNPIIFLPKGNRLEKNLANQPQFVNLQLYTLKNLCHRLIYFIVALAEGCAGWFRTATKPRYLVRNWYILHESHFFYKYFVEIKSIFVLNALHLISWNMCFLPKHVDMNKTLGEKHICRLW